MKWLAPATGLAAVLVLSSIQFPFDSYVIATRNDHGKILNFDTVTITRYVSVGPLAITRSVVDKSEIECIDITVEPATIIQSCRNTR